MAAVGLPLWVSLTVLRFGAVSPVFCNARRWGPLYEFIYDAGFVRRGCFPLLFPVRNDRLSFFFFLHFPIGPCSRQVGVSFAPPFEPLSAFLRGIGLLHLFVDLFYEISLPVFFSTSFRFFIDFRFNSEDLAPPPTKSPLFSPSPYALRRYGLIYPWVSP